MSDLTDGPNYTVEIGFTVLGQNAGIIGLSKVGQTCVAPNGADQEAGIEWTTVTGVQEIHTSFGRQYDLDKQELATGNVVFDNQDGRFSRENTSGPYYPNVKPLRRIRVTEHWADDDKVILYGVVTGWDPTIGGDGIDEMTAQCSSLGWMLARNSLTASFSQELSGARQGHVLDHAVWLGIATPIGWPASLRDIDAGRSQVAAASVSAIAPQQHLDDCAQADGAAATDFIAQDGKATFRDRYAVFTRERSYTSQATFGGPSGLGYSGIQYTDNADHLYNEVTVGSHTEDDLASQADYSLSALSPISNALIRSADEDNYARSLLAEKRQPIPNVTGFRIENGANGDAAMWDAIHGLDLLDRVTLIREFPGNLGLNRDFYIQGLKRDITEGLVKQVVQYQVSAAGVVEWAFIGRCHVGPAAIVW